MRATGPLVVALLGVTTMLAACERRPVDEVAAISAARTPAVPRGETSGTSGTSGNTGSSADKADSAINLKVQSALSMDADIKRKSVGVDTKEGEVTLIGTLDNQSQIEKAVKLASQVDGVKSVNNKLSVKR